MAWLYLLIAAGFEIAFAVAMKAADGFTKLGPSVVVVVATAGGIGFLTLALKDLPVGVGYPAWVGIGTVGSVAAGMLLFGETMTVVKALSVAAIIAGVIGLRVA